VKDLSVWLLTICIVVSCATTNLAPVTEETEFVPEEDEQRIWVRSVEEQDRLEDSGLVYRNAHLNDYVNALAQRVAPQG